MEIQQKVSKIKKTILRGLVLNISALLVNLVFIIYVFSNLEEVLATLNLFNAVLYIVNIVVFPILNIYFIYIYRKEDKQLKKEYPDYAG